MVLKDVAFSDDVINSTQLLRNWGKWAARANQHPVTFLYKGDPLTIISRNHIGKLEKKLYYTSLVFMFCQESIEGKIDDSSALPWSKYLSKSDRDALFYELINSYKESDAKDDWDIIQNVLDDWKATAEVESSPKLAKALLAKEDPSKYVRIKD
ncbi:hypothetical protein ACFLYE_01335 [Chloroflexota bacterium]